MANRNFASGGKIYSGHVMPVMIDCSFQVAASDSAGNGIINLTGPYVTAVYMNTSATPSAGNPNPAAGSILVQLNDNFNDLLAFDWSIESSPASGSDVKIDNAALTPGVAYIITTLGDATLAQWQGVGVPVGVTPAVGVAFIATAAGGSGNTKSSRVQTSAAAGSGIFSIEMIGNPNLSIAPSPSANQGYGASFILQCRKDSSSDAPVIAAPADGTVINLKFLLSNSSIKIAGE